jgi:hypothetical protein
VEYYTLLAEFTEVETGKGADALDPRPQLAAALQPGPPSVGVSSPSWTASHATSPSLPV